MIIAAGESLLSGATVTKYVTAAVSLRSVVASVTFTITATSVARLSTDVHLAPRSVASSLKIGS